MSFLSRSELLFGKEKMEKLSKANILIIGLGGVGSYAAEALARAGIGKMTLVDGDNVHISNINRQIQALHSTIDKSKSELMVSRIKDINPEIELTEINKFLMPEDMESLITNDFTYVLDCIDSVTHKINIITTCKRKKVKFISSMGAGGKTDPSKIEITDLYYTKDCYFSRDVRKKLRRLKYNHGIKVVYSNEVVSKDKMELVKGALYKRSYYGTVSYMPAMFGMNMASYVIRKITM